MKEQYHLISFSGGKDSTAMLLGMLECDMKIDCILFCDTRLEFPAMYDHIAKVEKNIGRKITIVRAEHTYLTVERHRGSTVPLGVWEVDETDEKNLDRYEGYPAFYYKKSVKLNVRSLYGDREQILDAFLYIMHEERHLGLPSAQYVSVCRQGYTDFGFNEKFLRRALADSMGDKK